MGLDSATLLVHPIFVSRFVHISSLDNIAVFASRIAWIGGPHVMNSVEEGNYVACLKKSNYMEYTEDLQPYAVLLHTVYFSHCMCLKKEQ
jgi:hypothetical protein